MLKTCLNDILGTEFPIIQGGMAHVSNGTFAAAVSEAGGLGMIATAARDVDYAREQVRAARALTKKPFGVNVMLANPAAPEIMRLILDEGVAIVATGAGSPAPYVKDLLANGSKVIPVVPHVRAAQKMQDLGVSAIVAEGTESGGHVGDVNTITLLPAVTEAVSIPVIAAGGFVDGRGFVAALAMGACGVQMGTRFLASEECPVSQAFKDAVLKANERATVVTGVGTKDPVRGIRNELTDKHFALRASGVSQEEWMAPLIGSLRRAVEGDIVTGSMQVGTSCALIHEIKPVRKIMEDIMAEAEAVLARLRTLG